MTFFSQPIADVMQQLTSRADGLSSQEATERLGRYGANCLAVVPPVPLWVVFLRQFKDFIIYVLLFAVVFSLLIGEMVDAGIILAILLLNGGIGFFQELSADRSLAALKRLTRIQAKVRRDGKVCTIVADDLVPGDIILLESGDKVPADGRLLSAIRLQVEESALTGESLPSAKKIGVVPPGTGLSEQNNMVFASTAVVAGRGTALVTATAMATEIGKISQLIQEAGATMTPLQRRLDRFGRRLGLVIIAICVVVFGVLASRQWLATQTFSPHIFLEMAFVAISLAVAAVPTALPAVVTISLAVGVKRLLARQCLVRRLASVETLGCCDVICSDKTGTLTKNEMTVLYGWSMGEEDSFTGTGYDPQGIRQGMAESLLYEIGLLCNNATLEQGTGGWQVSGDPTEGALLVSARKAEVVMVGRRLDELPFDSERKRMSVLWQSSRAMRVYTKGALDSLLACCDRVLIQGRIEPLTQAWRQQIMTAGNHYAAEAMRVLAFAYKEVESSLGWGEEQLIFVGLQAMVDPPRPDVVEAIRRAKVAGIRPIMITGDYTTTAEAVARDVGIGGQVMSGAELDAMPDNVLRQALLTGVSIFARVIPAHKQRIVKMLQAEGHVVAMTGDGVNDAPALKHADIGIALGSGTEVAKEAADVVLLNDSFANIVAAVEEGRGIYDNIQKSIMLLLSGNLGEVLIIFLAVVGGMNLPLTAVLLLWINMITDGAPALAYSLDPPSRQIMQRPPIPLSQGVLPVNRLLLLIFLGIVGTFMALFLFYESGGATGGGDSLTLGRTMVFTFIVLYEMILVFVVRGAYQVPFFANPLLWVAVLLTFALQGLVLYTPMAALFGVVALGWREIGVLAMAGSCFCGVALLFVRWQGRGR